MGQSARKIDPLLHSPRNVRDDKGKLIGTYFPSTQVIRLTGGELLQVGSSGKVRHPDGAVDLLDMLSFVLKPKARAS